MRITNPDSLFFPVARTPVFAAAPNGEKIRIGNREAVINAANNKVLGVVSKSYALVDNRKALAFARQCAKSVFPETDEDEWEILGADAPASKSYCHIDVQHNSAVLNFDYVMVGTREEVPDAYGPFIRVTNSYNGSRALKFTIGWQRKICSNGLTTAKGEIEFKFAHTREDIQSHIDFVIDHEKVKQMKKQFKEAFEDLHKFVIDKAMGKELVKACLAIRKPKYQEKSHAGAEFDAVQRDWYMLQGIIESIYMKYAGKLGHNAYAVLQAATELASNSINNRCIRRDKQSPQRLAGEWMLNFRRISQEPTFDLSEYLKLEKHEHEVLSVRNR